MSRLIVKNLPNKVTEKSLKTTFEEIGEVVDVQLKYTKDGKFRGFGFIGYRTEEQAAAAKEHFDGSYINLMKIQVQLCANLGDKQKPRAWSKYAPDSTAYKKLNKNDGEQKNKTEKKKDNIDKNKELLKKHKDDPLFVDFIQAHINEKTAWIKEALEKMNKSDDENCEGEGENDVENNEEMIKPTEKTQLGVAKISKEKIADKEISNLEYKKMLMKKADGTDKEKTIEDKIKEPKKVRNRQLFFVKLSKLPFQCTKKNIKDFFRPLVPFTIRLTRKGGQSFRCCYVGFRTDDELKKALRKDKLFLGKKQIHVHKYEDKTKKAADEEEEKNRKIYQERQCDGESIGESGSIFVRNLAYVICEEDLKKLFEKYGPIAEINMPMDQEAARPKGFATVTFMIPEHALKAYMELDGTVFTGRMLHLLPARAQKVDEDSGDEGLTFKEKKAKKLKAQAKSSHNWNTLFLGANAVADVMAANLQIDKEKFLNEQNKKSSAAVRLALGETQLVMKTREFLENNGVYLDAFNKPSSKRSKTCILVKNLPANTHKDEIKSLFIKYGKIARFLMPEHGISALVDYVEPFEAKKAFSKLAYSQFKTSPLYLEWAPENVFTKSQDASTNVVKEVEDEQKVENENKTHNNSLVNTVSTEDIGENNQLEPENDTTLFVKSLNFITTEDTLKQHFSTCGKIHSVVIAKKKDPKNPGQTLSMGYGFVQFYLKSHANEALKSLQSSTLDGKSIQIQRSERSNRNEIEVNKKKAKDTKQNGSKILVRNVPFEANINELKEIFSAFGDLRDIRLPKKFTQNSEQHRGFAFVTFASQSDARKAFEALCQSTHLYGRRLVLEWADSTEAADVNALRKKAADALLAPAPKRSRKATVDPDAFIGGGRGDQ